MENVEEHTVFINRKTASVDPLRQHQKSVCCRNDSKSFLAIKVGEIMSAKTIFENSAEYHPSQPMTISDSSVEIEAVNASYVKYIKSESDEGTIQGLPDDADAKMTVDHEDRGVCYSTSQYYETSIFNEDVTNPFGNYVESTIEGTRILFHIGGEDSSDLSNAENLNIIITPVPLFKRRKIVEELPEGKEDPYVTSIKTECEEDVHHVSPESTDADIVFGRDGENIECGTDNLKYDNECKIEETQILFGTEFAPAVLGSSEFSSGKDLDVAATPSVQVNNVKRSTRKFLNLDGVETLTLTKDGTEAMHISPKFSDREKSESVNTGHNLECDMSTKEKRYKCSNCNMRFKLKRTLDRHRMCRHSKPTSHKCLDSEQSFDKSHNLNNIQNYVSDSSTKEKRHSISKRHRYPDGGKRFVGGNRFVQKANLNYHQMSHHLKPKPHKCPECEKRFIRKSHLNYHQMCHHSKLKPHKCPECEMGFVAKQILERHQMSQHSKAKPHKCLDCEKSFARKDRLNEHQMSRHSKLKPHKCPDCYKRFIRKSHLNYHHMPHHSKLKPHKCPECEKSFTQKSNLHYHQKSHHSTLRPHKCPECEMGFVAKQILERHRVSQHSKPKLHECPCDCEKSFVAKQILERHQISQHSKAKPHKCPDCEKSFARKDLLNEHQMSRHSKLKPHKCPECEKRFTRKSYLNYHQMSHHSKLKPHNCRECFVLLERVSSQNKI